MKKILVLLFIGLVIPDLCAQEFYFFTGENFTNYSYKNSLGEENENIHGGNGVFFEVGYSQNLKVKSLNYSIGLSMNSFNATGGNTLDNYDWETKYLGVQNYLFYEVVDAYDFQVMLQGGLNLSTMIFGEQKIGGKSFKLKSEEEFKGLFVTPGIGISGRYNIWQSYISLGYNYLKSFSLSNSSDEKLSFNTHQIQFGIQFYMR